MSLISEIRLPDLLGLGRLVIAASAEVTGVVEAVQSAVAAPCALPGNAPPGRTRAVTGLVYRSIRGCYRLVDAGIEDLLTHFAPRRDDLLPSTFAREAVLAALNGVCGDYLAASDNPLAIRMSLRRQGQSLVLESKALAAALPDATGKLLVLVHGLCMSDRQWAHEGKDYGTSLAREGGYTQVYLHYNSGLHISTNGRGFADLLEALVQAWPQPITELAIIGHSMGGLVSRSACYYGRAAGHTWPGYLRKLIFLGTPHHGSPWERIGNWTGILLGATPYTAPIRRLGAKRSTGITDLRYGNLLDEDWETLDRFAYTPDSRRPLPLPDGVRCYALAGSLGAVSGDLKDRLLGDGMVSVASALGRHENAGRDLAFPRSQQQVIYNLSHKDLIYAPEVLARLQEWLAS